MRPKQLHISAKKLKIKHVTTVDILNVLKKENDRLLITGLFEIQN